MNSFPANSPLDLLRLYQEPANNRVSELCDRIEALGASALKPAYQATMARAPRRHGHGKRYFVGHNGITATEGRSNRREEHLAIALWHQARAGGAFRLAGGRRLDLLDYQVPLKARRADAGVGKIDLLGVLDCATPAIVELKIHAKGRAQADTPLRAFLEALAYAALFEANARDIVCEAQEHFGHVLNTGCPAVVVMAPEAYWRAYRDHVKAGPWWPALQALAGEVEREMDIVSIFVVLRNAGFEMGLDDAQPSLTAVCELQPLDEWMENCTV